jgi:hypothetical protein
VLFRSRSSRGADPATAAAAWSLWARHRRAFFMACGRRGARVGATAERALPPSTAPASMHGRGAAQPAEKSLCLRPRWQPRGGDHPVPPLALGAAAVARLAAGARAQTSAGPGSIRRAGAAVLVHPLPCHAEVARSALLWLAVEERAGAPAALLAQAAGIGWPVRSTHLSSAGSLGL